MDLHDALRRRRMVRSFTAEPVAPAIVDELLDLGRRAPSAGNTQAVGFVVLEGPVQTGRYWSTTMTPEVRQRFRWQGLLRAPVLVLVTTVPDRYVARYAEPDKARAGRGRSQADWPVPYWWVDAGAVVQNLLLLAVDRGLGACLFGPFDHEPALRSEFGLDPDIRLVATIAMGHPAADEPGRSASRPRPPLDQVVVRPT